jgi:hypothetical protein
VLFSPIIKYFCDVETFNLFITQQVKEIVELIYKELGERVYIGVYPDTAYENWGIPSGLALISDHCDTFLFPTFLRDPGCGFLLFKVEFSGGVEGRWHHRAGEILNTLIRRNSNRPSSHNPFLHERIDLQRLLLSGLEVGNQILGLQDYSLFQRVFFDVDSSPDSTHLLTKSYNL